MSHPTASPAPAPSGRRGRLTRSAEDRMVAGVCGGLARSLDVDATLVRVLTVVAVVFGVFPVVLAYLATWAILPPE